MVGIVLETLNGTPWKCDAVDLERIARAAAEGGFREVGVGGGHAVKMGPERARAILGDAGLTVRVVEWRAPWKQGPSAVKEAAEEGLDLLGILGAEQMVANIDAQETEFPRASEGFAALCEHAARRGYRVALEFIPPWSPADLPTAWRIVRELGAANGGLVIDTMHWHYQKAGPDLDLLRSIPGDKIHYVQLCDAAYARMPADKDYITVATTERPLPGDGLVDIRAILGALSDIGADPFYALEVYNLELWSRGPAAMARRLREVADQLSVE